MADSGARGSPPQIRQLAGMRGLMSKPDGSYILTPITSNFREGLNEGQYFISTHGARKGLSDTALKTANSGYLTRRLVDVAQDQVVTEKDCGSTEGVWVEAQVDSGEVVVPLHERIEGRVLADAIYDVKDKMVADVGALCGPTVLKLVEEHSIDRIKVRSPIMCMAKKGVCAKCYGWNPSNHKLVDLGTSVGIQA